MYFRTRIFAISILTVSTVLAVVISLSWSRIMTLELDHLDSRLCMEAKRIVPTPRPLEQIVGRKDSGLLDSQFLDSQFSDGKFIDDLVDKLRINSPSQLMLFVKSNEKSNPSKSEKTDLQSIIPTLNWTREDPSEITGKNRSHPICQFSSFDYEQKQWRISSFQAPDYESFIAVDVAATTTELKSTLWSALVFIIPFSLLLSALGAWFIATNTIKPINRLHKSMSTVTQKDLRHRLSEDKEDKEFKVLIDAYNTMLNRLESSFQQTSRFTADAAHELKTPLTVLTGKLEQAVVAENSSSLDLNAILDEVGHLSAITRKLLLLSQADVGSMALHLEPIDMTELLDELTADMALLSEDLVPNCSIEQGLIVNGDLTLLKQLLNNLLVNVMRYSLHGKGVTVQGSQNDSSIDVLIRNDCQSISHSVRQQLFERFYRGEPEHTQGISGSGLGLGLAREIARAHGGDLILEQSEETAFSVRLWLPTRLSSAT